MLPEIESSKTMTTLTGVEITDSSTQLDSIAIQVKGLAFRSKFD